MRAFRELERGGDYAETRYSDLGLQEVGCYAINLHRDT